MLRESETIQFGVGGEFDYDFKVEYIPYYERMDDWRTGVWNPLSLTDLDINEVEVIFAHVNNMDDSHRKLDYGNLRQENQYMIKEMVYAILNA